MLAERDASSLSPKEVVSIMAWRLASEANEPLRLFVDYPAALKALKAQWRRSKDTTFVLDGLADETTVETIARELGGESDPISLDTELA